jgi:hypothetical protein
MLTGDRVYNRREFATPFADTELFFSLVVMRRDAGSGIIGGVQPIFHHYMLALVAILLCGDPDDIQEKLCVGWS